MLRLGQLIGVPIGVAAIVAALAAVHAQSSGQTMGLRSAVTGDEDPARPTARERERQTRGFEPIGSGAGGTGFDSTNAKRRKAAASRSARAKRVTPPPQPALPQVVGVETTESVTSNTPQRPARPGQRPQRPGMIGSITPLPPTSVVRRRLPQEDDPFAPVGIRAGTFVLKPAIEVMGGYDTNAPRSNIPRGSSVLTVSPELKVQSDWLRHELTADIRGTYSAYQAIPSLDRPHLEAKVNGRIDASRQTRYDLEGRLLVGTDNPGSPDLRADLARLPIYTTVGGTAGVAHRFNRVEVALKGTIDRTDYQESKLTDGTTASNDTRNFTQYGTALRGSYDLLPGVKPFIEVGADTRVHDTEFDAFGVQRDSRGMIAKAGTTFEFSRKLTGEASVGYLNRTYEDARLQDLRGLIVDASLIWTATALTTVRLNAKSVADESTLIGVSGVLRRDATLEVEHAFRRWLIGTGRVGFGQDDYVGSDREDNRILASAALTYKLTRTAQVKGEFRQEWLKSSVPGNDYTASIIMVGLRLQR